LISTNFRRPLRIAAMMVLAGALSSATFAQEAALVSGTDSVFVAGELTQQKSSSAPPTPAHTGIKAMLKGLVTDFEHLPSKENALWAGLGGGAALAVHPADDNINAHLIGKRYVHDIFAPGRIVGATPTLLGVATVVYAFGRAQDQPKVSHLGMDLLRSVAVAEAVTQGLKYSTRRERPDGSGPTSFPSGHAADTFAFATALERHLGWRGAVPAYVIASYVATSRLHENRHFASDVVFGSAVGIIAGRTVTRHGRDYFSAGLHPVPGGMALLFVKHND
jgi:membrane-associated phospholipid phosphatase